MLFPAKHEYPLVAIFHFDRKRPPCGCAPRDLQAHGGLALQEFLYNPHMNSTVSNRPARLSLVSAIFTLFFFGVGFMPFLPLTALVCYPAALASAIVSLVSGLRGLRRPGGHWMAWTGISSGLLVILAVIFFSILTALFLPLLAQGMGEFWKAIRP